MTQSWGPLSADDSGKISGESAYYLSSNRNKRSLAIDITADDGQVLIHRLVRHCDVVIQNFELEDWLVRPRLRRDERVQSVDCLLLYLWLWADWTECEPAVI